MKELLAISFLLVFALSVFSGMDANAQGAGAGDSSIVWDTEGNPVGTFCKVERVDVCVVAMSEEDCAKIGGEKAGNCPMPEKTEDK